MPRSAFPARGPMRYTLALEIIAAYSGSPRHSGTPSIVDDGRSDLGGLRVQLLSPHDGDEPLAVTTSSRRSKDSQVRGR